MVFGMLQMATGQSSRQQVEDYINAAMATYGLPGLAYAVIKADSILLKGALGYADLNEKVKATTNTIYPIASMDKQLTATAIMILWEMGNVELDDPINKYLSDVPVGWSRIMVKHLLSHTSGIPDHMPPSGKKPISNEKLLAFIKKQELLFTPGDGWEYSDAGFVILQMIVEKISGQVYDDFQITHILRPLGMESTKILTPKITEGRALYYDKKQGRNKENEFRKRDRGPLYNDLGSTIEDFIKWEIAIGKCQLLKKSTYDLMWTPFELNNGHNVSNLRNKHELFDANRSYGYAWLLKEFNHHRIVYHSGYTGTSITRFPDDSLTVILFSNLVAPGGFNPDIVARHIAEFYLPGSAPYSINGYADPNPNRSAELHFILQGLESGQIDKSAFNAFFLENLNPAIHSFQETLEKRFGTFQSLDFLITDEQVGKKWMVYRANYSGGTLYYQIGYDHEDKIDLIAVER